MKAKVEALEFEHECVCMMKSGESGKDCKGVVAQKDKREWNLAENIQVLILVFGSAFSSRVVVCEHSLVTLSLTI